MKGRPVAALAAFSSWENRRNLLKQNRPILHRLGKKPCEINATLRTPAPQQLTAQLFDYLIGERDQCGGNG